MEPVRPGITRRTALRTAAWSAPVIAAAVATPLAAASGGSDSDLDLGVVLSSLPTARAKRHKIILKVYDFNNTGQSWSGSFTVDYSVAPDDSVVYINPNVNIGVGPASTPSGWSLVGLGPSGPNGPTVVSFSFSGVIPAGGAAELVIDDPYFMEMYWATSPGPSGMFSTTRSAVLGTVAGVPNTDTAAHNVDTQAISYTP